MGDARLLPLAAHLHHLADCGGCHQFSQRCTRDPHTRAGKCPAPCAVRRSPCAVCSAPCPNCPNCPHCPHCPKTQLTRLHPRPSHCCRSPSTRFNSGTARTSGTGSTHHSRVTTLPTWPTSSGPVGQQPTRLLSPGGTGAANFACPRRSRTSQARRCPDRCMRCTSCSYCTHFCAHRNGN